MTLLPWQNLPQGAFAAWIFFSRYAYRPAMVRALPLTMIRIEKVSAFYAQTCVLDNISLQLTDEKTHIFLGSSGSGKTTLLKLIMGLNPLSVGKISFEHSTLDFSNRFSRAKNMGYVLQEGGLFPHLTMAENITLQARLLKWPKGKISDRLEELSTLIDFSKDWYGRSPRELSGGQKQRGAVLRALFLNPYILLLDEPLGALDPLIRSKLQSDLKDIFTRLKKLVILVTHDLGEAAFFGDSISLFHEGRLIQHGTLNEMIQNPKDSFVTDFIQAQRTLSISENLR